MKTKHNQTVTIRLPLPDKRLSPNARCHWAVKAKAAKLAKENAFYEAKLLGINEREYGWKSARLQVVYTFKVRRVRDRDNHLSLLKAAGDGITAAGLLMNDSGIVPMPVEFEIGPDEGVTLTFERIE